MRLIRPILFLILLATGASAWACQVCGEAAAWRVYPPLITLGYIGYGWLAASTIVMLTQHGRLVDGRLWIILLSLVLAFLGLALGGLPILAMAMIKGVIKTFSPMYSWRHPTGQMWVTYVTAIIVTLIIARQAIFPVSHGPIDVVKTWPDTGPARVALHELAPNAETQVELHKIVEESSSSMSLSAAEYLIKHYDAESEIPFILKVWISRPEEQRSFFSPLNETMRLAMHVEEGSGIKTPEEWLRIFNQQSGTTSPKLLLNH